MELMIQPNPCACGQACIAMIANKSIEEGKITSFLAIYE